MEPGFAVLIPAYQPDELLLPLVQQLRQAQLPVVVVDDGGGEAFAPLFAAVEAQGCTVLHHTENKGKGRALKTGLSHLAKQGFAGAVTADADGQHTFEDICRVGQAMAQHPGALVLGVRRVEEMPPRSKFGNSLTRKMFSAMYGVQVSDTQTGLRGIPLQNPAVCLLAGERYEYEMNMLIFSGTLFSGIVEEPISTIYLNDNASSHFRPVRDGLKIYALLFQNMPRFLLASLFSFGLDYALFTLCYCFVTRNAVVCTVLARVISAAVNFLANKHFVFRAQNSKYTLGRYVLLAACILTANCSLMYVLTALLRWNALVCKIFVEGVLYVLSYMVQNKIAHQKK